MDAVIYSAFIKLEYCKGILTALVCITETKITDKTWIQLYLCKGNESQIFHRSFHEQDLVAAILKQELLTQHSVVSRIQY